MELWQFFGDLHPKLVHFPLVLLLAGLLFDLAGLLFKSDRARIGAHWAAKPLTAPGTIILLFAFISGIYAEPARSQHARHPADRFEPPLLGDDAPHLRLHHARPGRVAARRRAVPALGGEAQVGRPHAAPARRHLPLLLRRPGPVPLDRPAP